jgi:hypothetical protein
LRRRVQAANYGVGLRTAQSLDKLRITRRPGGLRGKELPVGRGYIVRSGQATMIQMATPYEGMGVTLTGAADLVEEEELQAQALDKWVAAIVEQYPEQEATWTDVDLAADGDGDGETAIVIDSEVRPAIDLLRRILYKQEKIDQETAVAWDDTDVLIKFIKEALKESGSADPDLLGFSTEDVFNMAQEEFPEIAGNGADEGEMEEEQATAD